jgi:ribosome-binding factor A
VQYKRADRVADRIMAEMSDILLKEVSDPRIGNLTITGVKVSDDLRQARIFFVEMGHDTCQSETREGLEHAKGFIRKELGRRLQLRHVPEIVFSVDSSFAYGSRIEKILAELRDTGDTDNEKNH